MPRAAFVEGAVAGAIGVSAPPTPTWNWLSADALPCDT
jgi:hypothetical protein